MNIISETHTYLHSLRKIRHNELPVVIKNMRGDLIVLRALNLMLIPEL